MLMSELPSRKIKRMKHVKQVTEKLPEEIDKPLTKRDIDRGITSHNKEVARKVRNNISIPIVFGGLKL